MNPTPAELWAEGRRHGFPPCCVARFIMGSLRPSITHALLPAGLAGRLRRVFSPRHAVADGMVPCEYHLLRYLLDGDRTGWRRVPAQGECCDHRAFFESEGLLRRETFEVEDLQGVCSDEKVTAWMMGHGDDAVSVIRCPWCGAGLT